MLHELSFGAAKSQRQEQNLPEIERLMFHILEFDREDAREAGHICAALALVGKAIGPLDALIAGQTRARGLTVVTDNTSEFFRVPGLQVENWRTP